MFAVVPTRQMRLAPSAPDDVTSALAALRAEVGLPAMFPQEVLEEARAAAVRDFSAGRADRRDIEFVTIDPPGSKDLDQAVHVEQSGEGYVVHYAIADLGAFVVPGGALDTEVRKRGMTIYGPDARTPLHPKILSEGAASLLPEEDRPAVLWTVTLNARGIITGAGLERVLVRSRERLTYAEVQSALDAGTASESLQLLADVGRLRQSLEVARGGVSLEVPEQEVERREDGTYALSFRRNLPVEEWNAQISLLTGIAAAHLMREAGVGILRTLPEADPRDLARLRRTARALGIEWPDTLPYARLVPTLVSRIPEHAAFLNEATTLFRGAGYVAFGMPGPDGAVVAPPENTRHAAIAADYAHVTAPLRRLVDRYATEICLAVSAGAPVPAWVLTAMQDLPAVMAETGRRASSFERECIDIVEASVLAGRLGEDFDGVVVDLDDPRKDGQGPQRGQVVLREPAVRARVTGSHLPLGDEVRVRLAEADVAERRVAFTLPGEELPDDGSGRALASGRGGRRSAGRRAAAASRPVSPPEPSPSPRPSPSSPEPTPRPGTSPEAARSSVPGSGSSGSSVTGRSVSLGSAISPPTTPAAPVPFARPDDGPVPAHGALSPEAAAGPVQPAPELLRPEPAAPALPRPELPRPESARPEPSRPEPPLAGSSLAASRLPEPSRPESPRSQPSRPQPMSRAARRSAEQGPAWSETAAGPGSWAGTGSGAASWPAVDPGAESWRNADPGLSWAGPETTAARSYPEPAPSYRAEQAFPQERSSARELPYPPEPSSTPDRQYPGHSDDQRYPQEQSARPASDGGTAASAPASVPPHPGHGVGYPPVRRPVRPQVRDEVPMSHPWPRHAPGPRRTASLSQPVPVVRGDGYAGGVHVAEYPVLSSRELPVVVAADLLAVEGPGPDGYRY